MKDFELRYVGNHVEVYTGSGVFLFSADTVREAMEELGITPIITPIRGGTDGARLSFMGLPCPNLCTGGHNFHGKYEFTCVQSMEKIAELLVQIVRKYAN